MVQKWSDINAEGGSTVDTLEALANGDKNNENFPYNPENVIVEKEQMVVKNANGEPVTLQKVTVSEKGEKQNDEES